jgi:TRAP-type C4-dicarboxylate transport system permease small subunit
MGDVKVNWSWGIRSAFARVTTLCDAIVAIAMFAMMLIVMTDVVARYVFNSPVGWSFDLISWYLMPAVFFFALASTHLHRQHINIDVLILKASPSVQYALKAVGALLSAALFAFIAYLGVIRAFAAFQNGETMYGELPWPTWMYLSFVPIGVGLLVIGLLLQAPSREPDRPEAEQP